MDAAGTDVAIETADIVLLADEHRASGMLIHEASVLAVILNGMRLLQA